MGQEIRMHLTFFSPVLTQKPNYQNIGLEICVVKSHWTRLLCVQLQAKANLTTYTAWKNKLT